MFLLLLIISYLAVFHISVYLSYCSMLHFGAVASNAIGLKHVIGYQTSSDVSHARNISGISVECCAYFYITRNFVKNFDLVC